MISPLDSTEGTSAGAHSAFSFSSFDECPSATLPKLHAKLVFTEAALPEPSSYDRIMNQFKLPNGTTALRRGSKLNSAMPVLISNPFNSEHPNACRRVQKIASATPVIMNYEEAYTRAEKFLDSVGLNLITPKDCLDTKSTPTLKPCTRMEKACSFRIKTTPTGNQPQQEDQSESEASVAMPSFLANRNKLVRAKTEKFKLSNVAPKPKEEEVKEDSCSPKSVFPVGLTH